ncbi:GGDEF domain-containing protein [Pandoraea oxalativorans]|uniref:diguanylate cyclase n=1 Tax=Pandoraea oxalativorans TaxID=573737 RepID=A0A0E3U8X9_9BURK|nr:GGDEF domain-containing protein [Pandoraea oxalativorans]AKC71713.1 diguanylate cyclase [Pandoraea oxalativorans]
MLTTSLLAITSLLSFMMLLIVGSLLRSRVAGVREWSLANVAVLVALPLFALRGVVPDFLSIPVANLTLSGGLLLYFAGCARFLGRRPHWPALGASLGVLTAAILFFYYGIDNPQLRVVIVSAYHAIWLLAVSVLILRHVPPRRQRYNYWLTAAMAAAFSVAHIVRGAIFGWTPAPGPEVFAPTLFNTIMLIIGTIVMPAMTMGAVLMIHDAMLATAEEAANRDYLTGALSRKHFDLLARQEMVRAVARGWPLSIVVIDLDHFKSINDTHGHAGGDTVLREFVKLVRDSLREGDVFGRLGGEEFAVLLPGTDTAGAIRIAERLRTQASRHLVAGPFGVCHYTLSGGVATWVERESLEALCMRADRALYAAKISGRNLVLSDVLPSDETASEAG